MSSLFGGSGNNVKIPKAPDPIKSYQGFIDAYLKNQPTLQNAEDTSRAGEDPLRIQQQQNLQDQFGPKQYQQMVDAFKQVDPTYFNNRENLGNEVNKNLSGPNPYGGLSAPNFNYANSVGNAYSGINSNVGNAFSDINPTANSQYQGAKSLLGNLQSQYALGTQLDPGQEAQVEQGLRGSQAARGNISGAGAGIAEGYALGDRGQQMQQQRLTNLQGGLGQAEQFGQQDTSNQFNLANANQGVNQQNFANQMGLGQANQGVNQANFVNQMGQGQQNWQNQLGLLDKNVGYNQQQIANAGSFLQLPNMGSLTAGIAPVSPDRSFGYINPNAGFQGVGLANQGYANQLGAAGLAQNTSGNPWMSALGAAGSVAGGLLASGAFSDERLKTDVKKIGYDKDKGLNLYEFAYKSPRKHVGYMAQEVQKTDPDAVWKDPASGYFKVSQEYAPLEVS